MVPVERRTQQDCGPPGAAGLCAPKFGAGPQFPSEGAKKAATATSLGRTGGKHNWIQSLLHTSTHLWAQGLGGTPLPGTRTGFLPQQIEAVNIDSLLFQSFLMPSDT